MVYYASEVSMSTHRPRECQKRATYWKIMHINEPVVLNVRKREKIPFLLSDLIGQYKWADAMNVLWIFMS